MNEHKPQVVVAQLVTVWAGEQSAAHCTVDPTTGLIYAAQLQNSMNPEEEPAREFIGINSRLFSTRWEGNRCYLADIELFRASIGPTGLAFQRFKIVAVIAAQEFHVVDMAGLFVAIAATRRPHSEGQWQNPCLSPEERWQSVTSADERQRYAALLSIPDISASGLRTILSYEQF